MGARDSQYADSAGVSRMRVLLAFEDDYRLYGDAIARAIREVRPWVEVAVAKVTELEAELARFDPHLGIGSALPSPVDREDILSWVYLAPDPLESSEFRVGGERREEWLNPSLEE